jgi:hypothetical protein
MIGAGGRGAETFEILGKPATMTARGAGIGSKALGAVGMGARVAGPIGMTLGMMEMLRMGAPAAGFSIEQLTAGNTKEFNEYLAAFHKDSKEGTENTNKLLGSINSTLQSTDKTLTGALGTGGTGTGGAGGPQPVRKPSPIAAGASTLGNTFMTGDTPENPDWANGLSGNPLVDFAPGGAGWNTDYEAGGMYGPGGSAGAPSVDYGGIDPYYKPGTVGNNDWTQVGDQWYYTDAKGVTHKVDGEGKYPKAGTFTPVGAGKVAGTGKTTKSSMRMEAEAAASQARAESLESTTREDFGYMNATALKGSSVGGVGEVVTQGKDVFIRQADGSLKQIASAASGGLLKASGLINAHAGEVIGPLGQVASTIASAATINNNAGGSNQNISITVNINGNADQAVTDDMIRRIKKDLFGRGVIA